MVSFNNQHDFEAAYDYALIVAEYQKWDPCIDLYFSMDDVRRRTTSEESFEIVSGPIAKPTTQSRPLCESSTSLEDTDADFKKMMTEMWSELKQREKEVEKREESVEKRAEFLDIRENSVEKREKAVREREATVAEKEMQLEESKEDMKNTVSEAIREKLGDAGIAKLAENMQKMQLKLDNLTASEAIRVELGEVDIKYRMIGMQMKLDLLKESAASVPAVSDVCHASACAEGKQALHRAIAKELEKIEELLRDIDERDKKINKCDEDAGREKKTREDLQFMLIQHMILESSLGNPIICPEAIAKKIGILPFECIHEIFSAPPERSNLYYLTTRMRDAYLKYCCAKE